MKQKNFTIIYVLAAVFLFLISESVFIVDEAEQAVITQLGRPIGDPILEPGFYLKKPFVQIVHRYDKRILEWDGDPNRIPTKDKRYIWVDTTARWRITDPLEFLRSFSTERGAQTRLDDILDSSVREVVSKHKLIEIVRTTNTIFEAIQKKRDEANKVNNSITPNQEAYSSDDSEVKLERIREGFGRDHVQKQIHELASPAIKGYGIELIDIRFKRINYDRDVRQAVYNRMRSERERASSLFRSEGDGKKAEIQGLKERELQRIQSEANQKAEIVKGKADAEAIKLYAEAYSKDPEFYSFLKSLEAFKLILNEKSRFVTTTENELLQFLKTGSKNSNIANK